MKRYFLNQLSAFCLWVLAIGLTMAACSEEDNGKSAPSQPPIEDFNQPDLNFTEQSGSQSFTFTAHEDWVVSVAPVDGANWCTVSPSSGTAGTHTVTISLEENEGYDDRSVTITLKAGAMVETFVVTQKQKDALLLSADKFEVPQEGGTVTVEAKANVAYTVSIGEECRDWITESPGTRGLTVATKSFAVAPNRSGDKREGAITFSNGTLTETVHVYQAPGDVILLTKDVFYADPAGDELQVELRSNCEYEVIMPQADWVQQATTRALSSHTLYYTILPNETYDTREAQVVYRSRQNTLAADTLTIVQNPKGAIVLSEKMVIAEQKGGTLEVSLSTNVDYEVHIPENVDWITGINTKGLTTHTLRFEVAPNEKTVIRSAKIAFSNEAAMLHDTLTVVQNGTTYNYLKLHVSTPGSLGSQLTNLVNIRGLILSGNLNGDDIKMIRRITTLQYLDLAEANIVKGGAAYYYSSQAGECYTEDNVVGAHMFRERNYLKTCILPRSATAIGVNAFADCRYLENVQLFENIVEIGRGAFYNCLKLAEITIPKGVTSIAGSTFRECVGLTRVTIPEGVTSIGNSAFSHCTNLETITIPKSVAVIDIYAFDRCYKLSEVILQEGLSRIESGAFIDCYSLKWLSLPSSITYLGTNLFFNFKTTAIKSALRELWCYAPVAPETESSLGVDYECTLFIPKGSTGYTGEPWDSFGEIVEFDMDRYIGE